MTPGPHLSRRSFLGMAAATPLATTGVLGAGAGTARAAGTAYVMAYFTESPNGTGTDYGLHLAVSTDSLNWMPLNQNHPVVTPTEGALGLRDPFILRKQDGTFVVSPPTSWARTGTTSASTCTCGTPPTCGPSPATTG